MFWGKKKKESAEEAVTTDDANSMFAVHTMEDDVREGVADSSFSAAPTPTTPSTAQEQEMEAPTESPFLQHAPQDDAMPQQQKSGNPFFGGQDKATMSDPLPTQSPQQAEEHIEGIKDDEKSMPVQKEVEPQVMPPTPMPAMDVAPQKPLAAAGTPSFVSDVPEDGDDVVRQFAQEKGLSAEHTTHGGKVIWIMIAIVVVLLIAGGVFAWYWFTSRAAMTETSADAAVETTDMTDATQDDTTGMDSGADGTTTDVALYSRDLPNYITLTSSQTAYSDLTQELATITTNVQAQGISDPISFLVSDVDGTPFSFRAFTTMTRIALAEDILAALGDNFELYAYSDAGVTHFGLAVDVRDAEALKTALLAEEYHLPEVLQALFAGANVDFADPIFQDSSYDGYTIRYVNLTATDPYSVDYATNGQRLLIATSKDTMRAMISRLQPTAELVPTADDTTLQADLPAAIPDDTAMTDTSADVPTDETGSAALPAAQVQ